MELSILRVTLDTVSMNIAGVLLLSCRYLLKVSLSHVPIHGVYLASLNSSFLQL